MGQGALIQSEASVANERTLSPFVAFRINVEGPGVSLMTELGRDRTSRLEAPLENSVSEDTASILVFLNEEHLNSAHADLSKILAFDLRCEPRIVEPGPELDKVSCEQPGIPGLHYWYKINSGVIGSRNFRGDGEKLAVEVPEQRRRISSASEDGKIRLTIRRQKSTFDGPSPQPSWETDPQTMRKKIIERWETAGEMSTKYQTFSSAAFSQTEYYRALEIRGDRSTEAHVWLSLLGHEARSALTKSIHMPPPGVVTDMLGRTHSEEAESKTDAPKKNTKKHEARRVAGVNATPVKEPKICCVCDKPAKNYCKGCHAVWYCSRVCQKKHWRVHKPDCFTSIARGYSFKKREEEICKKISEVMACATTIHEREQLLPKIQQRLRRLLPSRALSERWKCLLDEIGHNISAGQRGQGHDEEIALSADSLMWNAWALPHLLIYDEPKWIPRVHGWDVPGDPSSIQAPPGSFGSERTPVQLVGGMSPYALFSQRLAECSSIENGNNTLLLLREVLQFELDINQRKWEEEIGKTEDSKDQSALQMEVSRLESESHLLHRMAFCLSSEKQRLLDELATLHTRLGLNFEEFRGTLECILTSLARETHANMQGPDELDYRSKYQDLVGDILDSHAAYSLRVCMQSILPSQPGLHSGSWDSSKMKGATTQSPLVAEETDADSLQAEEMPKSQERSDLESSREQAVLLEDQAIQHQQAADRVMSVLEANGCFMDNRLTSMDDLYAYLEQLKLDAEKWSPHLPLGMTLDTAQEIIEEAQHISLSHNSIRVAAANLKNIVACGELVRSVTTAGYANEVVGNSCFSDRHVISKLRWVLTKQMENSGGIMTVEPSSSLPVHKDRLCTKPISTLKAGSTVRYSIIQSHPWDQAFHVYGISPCAQFPRGGWAKLPAMLHQRSFQFPIFLHGHLDYTAMASDLNIPAQLKLPPAMKSSHSAQPPEPPTVPGASTTEFKESQESNDMEAEWERLLMYEELTHAQSSVKNNASLPSSSPSSADLTEEDGKTNMAQAGFFSKVKQMMTKMAESPDAATASGSSSSSNSTEPSQGNTTVSTSTQAAIIYDECEGDPGIGASSSGASDETHDQGTPPGSASYKPKKTTVKIPDVDIDEEDEPPPSTAPFQFVIPDVDVSDDESIGSGQGSQDSIPLVLPQNKVFGHSSESDDDSDATMSPPLVTTSEEAGVAKQSAPAALDPSPTPAVPSGATAPSFVSAPSPVPAPIPAPVPAAAAAAPGGGAGAGSSATTTHGPAGLAVALPVQLLGGVPNLAKEKAFFRGPPSSKVQALMAAVQHGRLECEAALWKHGSDADAAAQALLTDLQEPMAVSPSALAEGSTHPTKLTKLVSEFLDAWDDSQVTTPEKRTGLDSHRDLLAGVPSYHRSALNLPGAPRGSMPPALDEFVTRCFVAAGSSGKQKMQVKLHQIITTKITEAAIESTDWDNYPIPVSPGVTPAEGPGGAGMTGAAGGSGTTALSPASLATGGDVVQFNAMSRCTNKPVRVTFQRVPERGLCVSVEDKMMLQGIYIVANKTDMNKVSVSIDVTGKEVKREGGGYASMYPEDRHVAVVGQPKQGVCILSFVPEKAVEEPFVAPLHDWGLNYTDASTGPSKEINQNICNQIMDLSLKKISDPESFAAKFTSMSEQKVQEAESESGTCLKPGYHRYHLRMEER